MPYGFLKVWKTTTRVWPSSSQKRFALLLEAISRILSGLLTELLFKFGAEFSISQSDDNGFEIVMARIHNSEPTDRIILFKPHKGMSQFGCIRVLRSETADQGEAKREKKGPVWDVVRAVGSYVGLVPAGCPFEAMVVQLKFIAKR